MNESRAPETLTETIEFELIREMLGPHGEHGWRVDRAIPLPGVAESKIWELSCEPAKGETLLARAHVGSHGICPDRSPRLPQLPTPTQHWMGRDLLWEGQPEDDFSRTVQTRSGIQLEAARKAFGLLKTELDEKYSDVSPEPGRPRTRSKKRRVFPSINPDDLSEAKAFFRALHRRFRGFDGPENEALMAPKADTSQESQLSLDLVDLPFYAEGSREISRSSLVELADRRSGRPRKVQFVWWTKKAAGGSEPGDTLHLRQLDGRSEPIHALNRTADLHLLTQHVAEYVRFASSNLHGEAQVARGREYPVFEIVEDVDDLQWYPEMDEAKRLVAEHIAPIRVDAGAEHDDPNWPYRAGAFIFFAGTLSFCVFEVKRTHDKWPFLLEMIADFPLFSSLPARPIVHSAGNRLLLQTRKGAVA